MKDALTLMHTLSEYVYEKRTDSCILFVNMYLKTDSKITETLKGSKI